MSRMGWRLWGTQLIILALVLHVWMDMMGSFEAGGRVASILIVAGLVVYMTPDLSIACERLKEYYTS